jgi:hypothetical protein
MKKRPVYIEPFITPSGKLDSYLVCYADRVKHGHHYAATFAVDYAEDEQHDLEWVKAWVNSQDHLELVDKPKSK